MKGETETLALVDGVCETVKGEVEPEVLLDGECETVKGDADALQLPLALADKLSEAALHGFEGEGEDDACVSISTVMTAAPSPPTWKVGQ